jgi:allantoin racemase
VILAGFGEHGKDALQEMLAVPVFDIAECAAHVAHLVGRRFSVVTTLARSIAPIEDRLALAGVYAPGPSNARTHWPLSTALGLDL